MKGSLSATDLADCIAITDALLKSPGSYLFRRPVDLAVDHLPGYFDVVKDPQDLGTIRHRLDENYYSSFSDWNEAVCLVWSNALRYNRRDVFLCHLVKFLAAKFEKMKKTRNNPTRREWFTRVTSLYAAINVTMRQGPPVTEREFAGKDFDGPVTVTEIQRLGRAAAKVTDHSDLTQMLQVLSYYGVDVDFQKEEGLVNLRTLSEDGLKAFMTCVKERYRAQKLPYPN
jgi:hypothetical protein